MIIVIIFIFQIVQLVDWPLFTKGFLFFKITEVHVAAKGRTKSLGITVLLMYVVDIKTLMQKEFAGFG